jgi:hypothetical protein
MVSMQCYRNCTEIAPEISKERRLEYLCPTKNTHKVDNNYALNLNRSYHSRMEKC